MSVSSTFLEYSLNFRSNNLKNTTKFSTFKEKNGDRFELSEIQFERTVRDKIACKTDLGVRK